MGWVRRREIIDGSRIRPGDVILGLPSLGLHTNGYSLARKVLLEQEGMSSPSGCRNSAGPWATNCSPPSLLLAHRQAPARARLAEGFGAHHRRRHYGQHAAHPSGRTQAEVRLGSWPVLPIFRLDCAAAASVPDDMLRTFNMGLGMMLIVAKAKARARHRALAGARKVLGHRRNPARKAGRSTCEHW